MMTDNPFQIICVVETNSTAKTDQLYIDKVIKHFYELGKNKLSFVYMNSKTNFESSSTQSKIKKKEHLYKIGSNGKSHVIYFIDRDFDSFGDDSRVLNGRICKFCVDNHYLLVWFDRDIEEVMWKKSVDKGKKIEYAKKFLSKNQIENLPESNLRQNSKKFIRHKTNMLTELDKLLV